MRRSLFAATFVAVSILFSSAAAAQTLGCELNGPGGPIPASGTGGGTGTLFPTVFPPFPSVFPLNVVSTPVGATCVTEVRLNGLSHTYTNDVHFILEDPTGALYNLWCRPGGSCDFVPGGNYSVVPVGGCGTTFPTCVGTTPVPVGAYEQVYGAWPSGTNGVVNADLTTIAPQTGTWILHAYDWVGADSGTLTTWDICFGTPPAPQPPCGPPTLLTPANNASLFGPNVNLTWSAIANATSYDVDVDGVVTNVGTNSFAYSSVPGQHTWTVRAVNGLGVSAYASPFVFNDLGVTPQPCGGIDLNTINPFVAGNGGSVGGIVFFDINVLNPAGITISQLDTNTSLAIGNQFGMTVYMIAGTSVGFETNQAAWTVVANGSGISAGQNQHSVVEFPDFAVPPGTHGVALVLIGAAHQYTNGNGGNQFFANADLSISLGKAQNVPFTGTPFSPRVWNGTIRYNCPGAGPVVYCTAGTSSNGCVPAISADNQPSVSQANACNISVANVEGQKSGLIFYGLAQHSTPWALGSTSFLCVKAPTQRTGTQSSNGTAGACDGSLALDFHAYLTGHPGALGQPFVAGNKVYGQAWYRDPPAAKTTNLSDGIELTFQP